MKKEYQKPWILIEDFQITDAVASSTYSCGVKAGLADMESCDILNIEMDNAWNRHQMFGERVGCERYPDASVELCYHGAVLNS